MFRKLILIFIISVLAVFGLSAQQNYNKAMKSLESFSPLKISGWSVGNDEADLKTLSDESKWKSFNGEYSTDEKFKWFKAFFTVPEKIAADNTKGKKIILDIEADGECEVYLDGSMITEFKNLKGQKRCVIFESAEPNTKHTVALKLKQSTIISRFFGASLETENMSAVLKKISDLKLSLEAAQMMTTGINEFIKNKKFSINQSQTPETKLHELRDILEHGCAALDFKALETGKYNEFTESIAKSYKIMEPLSKFAKEYTIYITGNAHIDAAWLWRKDETLDVARYTFVQQLKLIEEYPEFIFSQSSAVYYKWMEKYFPDIFEKIKDKTKKGNWDLVGGTILEPDCNLISGEAWARQLLYGQNYFSKTFGEVIPLGWNPDSFGYNWNMPQLYSLAGIKAFITQKISWNDTNEFPYHLFWWQGVDGSKILTYFPMSGYVNSLDFKGLLTDLKLSEANTGRKDVLVLYGFGDHGGGPERFMLENVLKFRENPFFPNVSFTKAYDYLKNMSDDYLKTIPVWKDELYLEYHRGTFTTQAATKSGNRRSEFGMANAEKLSSLAMLYGKEYPQKDFTEAWETTLFNQFHDILPGSSIAPVYKDAKEDYDHIKNVFCKEQQNSAEFLSSMINTQDIQGMPFTIFNQSSWDRKDICNIDIPKSLVNKNITVSDEAGKIVPSQIINGKICFVTGNIPAMGYASYSLNEAKSNNEYSTTLKAENNSIENNYFSVKVNDKTGNLSSIYDKQNKKEILAAEGNLIQLYDDKPLMYDAWEIRYTGIKWDLDKADEVSLIEKGPVAVKIRVKKSFLGSSKSKSQPASHFPSSFFTQDIILYNDIPRIDVELEADWWEERILAKMALPVNITSSEATYEIPNSAIKRPTTRNNSWDRARYEVPALTWADLSDDNYGVSILNLDKYGHEIKGNTMTLTLLRAPIYPDPRADRGKHKTLYSIYPHKGSWQSAETPNKAFELNNPFIICFNTKHEGKLPKSYSFMKVDKNNIIISAVKKAEKDNALILRIYESTGAESSAVISLPVNPKKIYETDILEVNRADIPSGKSITLKFKPFETKTIRVEY